MPTGLDRWKARIGGDFFTRVPLDCHRPDGAGCGRGCSRTSGSIASPRRKRRCSCSRERRRDSGRNGKEERGARTPGAGHRRRTLGLEDGDSGPTEKAFYDASFEDEAASNAYYARSLLGCISAMAVIEPVTAAALTNARPRVRAVAAADAATLARNRASSRDVVALRTRLRASPRAATDEDERAAHLMALRELGAWRMIARPVRH
jgi:hypothetical protein